VCVDVFPFSRLLCWLVVDFVALVVSQSKFFWKGIRIQITVYVGDDICISRESK